MKLYEHIKTFDVKYCDTDFKDELKPSAVLAYLEEVACSSADELGFGYSYLKPRGYAFMLTNIRCEFLSPVPLGAHITVKTWPTPPSYVVFGREYQILSVSGDILMNATSRWCMVDMKSGRLLQSKVLDNQDYSAYNPSRALDVNRWKLPPFTPEEGELRFSLIVANSEYDHNMHVKKRLRIPFAQRADERRSIREVRDKVPVHDIHMEPIGFALKLSDVTLHIEDISGQQRGGDDDLPAIFQLF